MSGGSYDNLHLKEFPQVDRENVRRMAERLRELGHDEAAAVTETYLIEPDDADLRALWRAVEFFDSGDLGRESVEHAAEHWATGPK